MRPRVVADPVFLARLDPEARDAVLAHEAAHAAAYDPLRLLIAQFLADLQWPLPAARARLHAWREALEIARDEDARLGGADGGALAEGILAALRSPTRGFAGIAIAGAGDLALRARIERLLRPVPARTPRLRATWRAVVGLGSVAMVLAGVVSGDAVLRTLCSVLP